MRVFKVCLKVTKQKSTALLIYIAFFITLSVIMTSFSKDKYTTDFSELRPEFTIINRDGESDLVTNLHAYLNEHGSEVVLEDEKQVLQDAAFYQASSYILIIPEGFSEKFYKDFSESGRINLETITSPDSAKGYYMDYLVNQYLNTYGAYLDSSPDMSAGTIASVVKNDLSVETEIIKKQYSESQPVDESIRIYSHMYAYIIIVLGILCISTLMMVFRRPDLNMRNLCAPMEPRSMNGQIALCGWLITLAAWVGLVLTAFIMYRDKMAGTDIRILLLILLNSFVFMAIALCVGFICGLFVKSASSQNAVGNFLSLSMSFLGGSFVPLELLGSNMLKVSQFTPTYWYISTLNKICALQSFSASALNEIWKGMMIQLLFAAAIFSIALVISKNRQQSNKGFGVNETQLES